MTAGAPAATAASAARPHGASPTVAMVWDPLVRLVHWSVALLVLLNGAILDDEGLAHELVGYAALTLVALRLLWGVIGPRPARFAAFPPSPRAAVAHLSAMARGDRSAHLSHNPLGALMVYNIWATLLALCVSGILMGTPAFFGVDWVEDLHEMAFDWLVLSIALHVGGVALDARRTGVNLVRAMLTGRKTLPPGGAGR